MKKKTANAESPEQMVKHLRELLHEAESAVGDTAGQYVGEKAEAMRERFQQAQERLEELYETTRNKVVASAKTADTAIRDHPYESIAIALGVGVLIGAVLRRR